LGWRPGPAKVGQNFAKTCPHYDDVIHREPQIQNEKNIFPSQLELAESVDGLKSSVAQSAGELGFIFSQMD